MSNQASRPEGSQVPEQTATHREHSGCHEPTPLFDLAAACKHLSACDPCLAELIENTAPFQMDDDPLQSPYEALLEAIAYQSISGKAAATGFQQQKRRR